MLIYTIFAIALLCGLLIGYTTAVIAGALVILDSIFHFTAAQEGLIVSSILIGGFLGALFSSRLVNPFGPKKTLFIIAIIFILGSLGITFSSTFYMFLLFRFIIGIAVGLATMVGPLYVAETAPSDWRGLFVASVQLAITIGIFLAYVANYLFTKDNNWPAMFLLAVIPAILLCITSFWIVESPRWLMLKGKEHLAKQNYYALHGTQWNHPPIRNEESSSSIKQLFNRIHLPIMLFSCGLFFFQNLSGIDAILYYAPSIFMNVGFTDGHSALFVTVLLGLINIIATVISMWLIDRVGRRNLLITGLIVMAISLLLFSSLTHFQVMKWLCAMMLMLFLIAFAVSIGPIPYVLMSELFPLKLRAAGMGIASATAWGINALITFVYPILTQRYGISVLFFGFAMVCIIALIISLLFCPETKQRSLEAIEANLNKGSKLRNLGE